MRKKKSIEFLGTPGSGTVVILDTQSPTDYFAGGNKWWDFSGAGITGYVGKIDNSGNSLGRFKRPTEKNFLFIFLNK